MIKIFEAFVVSLIFNSVWKLPKHCQEKNEGIVRNKHGFIVVGGYRISKGMLILALILFSWMKHTDLIPLAPPLFFNWSRILLHRYQLRYPLLSWLE